MAPNPYTTCEICEEAFTSETHKPLVLPCGHTYCHKCLLRLKKEELWCPKCRKKHAVEISTLPVCYQLIPKDSADAVIEEVDDEEEEEEDEEQVCSEHNTVYSHWCYACKCQLCHQCFHPKHVACSVTPLDFLFKEKCPEMRRTQENIVPDISEKKKWLQKQMEKNNENRTVLNDLLETVNKMQKDLEDEKGYLSAAVHQLDSDFTACYALAKQPLTSDQTQQILTVYTRLHKLTETAKKFNKPSIKNLCNFAKVLEETEDDGPIESEKDFGIRYIKSNFCNPFCGDSEWLIENDLQAFTAYHTLVNDPCLRPFEVMFRSNGAPSEAINNMGPMLPFMAEASRCLSLHLLHSFWQPCTPNSSPSIDDASLEPLLNSPHSEKLRHFLGCVSHGSLVKLKRAELYTLGLHILSPAFVATINSLLYPTSAVVHFCIGRGVRQQQLPPLATSLYTCSACHLHLPDVADGDVAWVCGVVQALIPHSYHHHRADSLCLPRCQLTMPGLRRLLAETARLKLTADVCCQHDSLLLAHRNPIIKYADSLSITLSFSIQL
ncbi:uncharacterized protein LOC108680050 isoform X1 [Hyalella azteca]|uniref:Uncharacterized protein LOC108680050 isoform X1 n=2 Tax=Hyalella azteca TaxID=294128 RepID=A0A979FNL1_HYAAZ|nr:uncharacterized protein LOC108680050 isoform X1 [Hyalella azteca]